ncbi:MAG: response regulator [Bacteroidota bacterium]
MKKISIVIADDHALIRLGLSNIINKHNQYELLGEFDNGKTVLEYVLENEPDIAVLDIEMPVMNGLEVCKHIRENKLETKVIFLTMLNEESVFNKARLLGANGYILKDFALEELAIALEKVHQGNFYLSYNLSEKLSKKSSKLLNDEVIKQKISVLTATEKKVLQLIAINLNSKQIAEKIFSSELTIKTHRQNIMRKLELNGEQNSLTKFAVQNKDYLI